MRTCFHACVLGLVGGVLFASLFPAALFFGWVYVAFWIGSGCWVGLRRPRFRLVTTMIPSAVAACVATTLLWWAGALGGGTPDPSSLAGYLTAVGWVFALPCATVTRVW